MVQPSSSWAVRIQWRAVNTRPSLINQTIFRSWHSSYRTTWGKDGVVCSTILWSFKGGKVWRRGRVYWPRNQDSYSSERSRRARKWLRTPGLAREHRQPHSKVSPLKIWMMTLVPIQNRTCTLMSTPPTKGLPSHRSAARAPSCNLSMHSRIVNH